MSELRKSGIDILGEIPWGSHVCNFYETNQDLLDILVPYFKAGLENNEFCLLVISGPPDQLRAEDAINALRSAIPGMDCYLTGGNIEIVNHEDWFLTEGIYDLQGVIRRFIEKLNKTVAKGFSGMRVNGGSAWLLGKEKELDKFEKQLGNLIAGQRMIVLCNFPLHRTTGEDIFDITHTHRFTIALRKGEWQVIETGIEIQALTEIKRLNQKVKQAGIKNMRTGFFSYSIAFLSVALALVLAHLLELYLVTAPVSLFFCAMMFNAWYGGLRPGLLAVALSLLAFMFFFIPPFYSLAVGIREVPRVILFAVSGLFIVLLSATQRGAAQSLITARNVLEKTVQKLKQTNIALQEEITERKKSQLLTIKEKELSNEIIDSIPGLVMVVDQNMRFLRWNKDVEIISGYTPHEILELHAVNDFYDDADEKEKVQGLIEEAFKNGAVQGEVSPSTKDGKRICFYFNARLIDYEGKTCVICIAIDVTERKMAEEKLNTKEQQFRAIVENTPDHIIMFDREFRRTYVNPAVVRTYGMPAQALEGKPVGSVVQDQGLDIEGSELEQLRQRIASVFGSGESCQFEMSWPSLTGRICYSVGLFPELDIHGSVINVMGIARDITERKHAEDALRQNEDRIRLIIDTIPIMAWSIRPDGSLDFINLRWLDYSGLSLKEEIEKPTQIIHPEDLPGAIEKWRVNMAKGQFYEDEMRLRRADGEYRRFLVRTAPLRNEQGDIVSWYGVSIDIEDSKQAENALRESELRLRQIAENIREVFWMATPGMDEILYVSPAYESIWGRSMESLYQRPRSFVEAIHPEDRKYAAAILTGQREEGFDIEYRILKPDGSMRWIRDRGFPVKSESGKIYRIAGVSEDITDRKGLDDALRESEQRYLSLFENMSEGVVYFQMFFADGRAHDAIFLETNPAWEKLTGLTNTVGLKITDIFPDIGKPDSIFFERAGKVALTGQPDRFEVYSAALNKWLFVSAYCPRKEHVIVVFDDITERKLAEETLQYSYEEIRRLTNYLQKVREEERIHIAREIHDELGQQLTAIKMDVAWIDKKTPQEAIDIKRKLKNIIGLLDGSNQSVRRILSELRPRILDNQGLLEAIEWLGRQFTETTGIPVKFTTAEKDIKVPEQTATCIFRVCQEAFTNITRYSYAKNVSNSINIIEEKIILTIEDDGIGFDTSVQNTKSFGILGMRERVLALGGQFILISFPGKGTQIIVSLPL